MAVALILVLVAVPLVLPLALWVALYRTRTRLTRLERALVEQNEQVERLSTLVRQLGTVERQAAPETVQPVTRPAAPERPVADVAHATLAGPPRAADRPAPRTGQPVPPDSAAGGPRPHVQPALQATPAAGQGANPPLASAPAITPTPLTAAAPVREPAAAAPTNASTRGGPAGPPPPRTPASPGPAGPPLPPPPPTPEGPAFDWESLVGVKLFSAVAGIALVFAAVFFLRYSVQQGWLQPQVRVLIGTAVGVGLLVVCERRAAQKYPVTANALDAAAIAILFATFFAAHALWDLIPALVTFGLLAAVTALAVLLSVRRESIFIAVLGLLGGFATPALLSTGENRPIPLFAYLALLNVGLSWVAYRQNWPVLTALTLVFTTMYQWVWVQTYLNVSDLSLAMAIFALFPLLSVGALVLGRQGLRPHGNEGEAFERTTILSAALPLLFAAYLATVPAYGARPGLLFGFLLLMDAGLLAVTIALRRMTLHATSALATLLIWAIWLGTSYSYGSRVIAVAFVSSFVLLYLFAPTIAGWFSRALTGMADGAVHAAPALLVVFAVLAGIDARAPEPWPLFVPLLLLLLILAWRATVIRRGLIFFAASFFSVAAQAVWSATHLTIERLPDAVALYATFGVVNAAVPVLARRRGRELRPRAGAALVLLSSLALLLFLSAGAIAPEALWALALLLSILNGAMFVESATSRVPVLAQVGSILSWLILTMWWIDSAGAVGMLPSLAVLTGLTLLTFAGHALAFHTAPGAAAPGPGLISDLNRGLYIGLTGHLYLFFLALNREWSLPPYPLFGTILVITLGASVTALSVRAPLLHVLNVGATAIVIAGWTSVGSVLPWTQIGLLASAALSVYALAWIAVSGWAGRGELAAAGAAAALFGGELTAVLAAAALEGPPFRLLIATHVLNLVVLLVLAWRAGWNRVAAGAVAVAWLAVLEWQLGHELAAEWRQLLVLAVALYAVFTVYALMVGPRRPEAREPWLVALAAAAMTFFAARDAFDAGGLQWMVGVVPVAQGVVTAFLLRALLRIERSGERDMTRLVLVAGAALAFVTVAIPLQLERQWITIGWALEGAALAWLYQRVPHRGLLAACISLLGVAFVRLTMNPAVWNYAPRGTLRILNWYLYAYAIVAASLFAAAWFLSRTADRPAAGWPRFSQLLPGAAVILLFLLLNIEIADYYATGPEIAFRFGATGSQDLTYTIGWLAFGMILLAAGIYVRSRPARITAVALIAVTTFKCFLYDLRTLEGLYRVASFVGLALALALVSLALQKYVLARPRGTA